MNKKASEKINTGMFLLYLIIIAGGLTFALSSYVNFPFDARPYESQIIYDRAMGCFVSNGFVEGNVFGDYDLFKSCSLDKRVIDSSNIYFEFSFLDENGKELKSFVGGDMQERNAKKDDCEIIIGTKTENAKACLFRNESALYFDGKKVISVNIVGWAASFNEGVRK